MSNVDAASELFTAINFDRFAEIEARHNPDVVFHSFRGPILRSSVAVGDWHRDFLRDYADCNYAEVEFVEEGDVVAARATLEAKGYDWRPFTQRVVEVLELEDGGIAARRLYAMLADLELDKPSEAAMKNAVGFRGGSVAATRKAAEGFFSALLAGDAEAASAFLDAKAALIDTVYGVAVGPDNVVGLFSAIPRPAFGQWRVTRGICGPKEGLVEMAIDPSRPRAAAWVRMVEDKIGVIELYWMFKEIGINPTPGTRPRHSKQVIMPI